MSSLSSGQTCGHSPCPGLPKPPSQEVCCLIRIWAKATVSREEPPGLGHLVAGTSGDVGEEEVLKPGLSPVGCVGVGPLGTWVGGALEQAPPHGLLSREPCSPAIAPGTSQALTGSWPLPKPPPRLPGASTRPCRVLCSPSFWSPSLLPSRCLTSLPAPWIPKSHSAQAPPSSPTPAPRPSWSLLPLTHFMVGLPGELAPHPRAWASQSHQGLGASQSHYIFPPQIRPPFKSGAQIRREAQSLPRHAPFSSLHSLSPSSNSEWALAAYIPGEELPELGLTMVGSWTCIHMLLKFPQLWGWKRFVGSLDFPQLS